MRLKKLVKLVIFIVLLFVALVNKPAHAQVATDECGYVHLAANGKGLVCSKTGKLFVPLGWKATFPWNWEGPNRPRPVINNLSFEEWVRDVLAANGVNFINIWLNTNQKGSGVSFEHNAGEFNAAMDNGSGKMLFVPLGQTPEEKAQIRNTLYGDPSDISDGSNITQLIEACEKYGVKIKISLYRQPEFMLNKHWDVSPYNKNRITYPCADNSECWWCNNSPNGCLPGPANTPQEALTDYIHLQKNRFQFIYDNWGDSPAIAIWELMVEINWTYKLYDDGFEGLKNWVREMAAYIESVDQYNRPILLGQIQDKWRPWGSPEYPALPDPTDIEGIETNKIYDLAEVGIPSVHNYQYFNLWDRFIFHRLVQERFPTKTIHFGGGSGPSRAICWDDGYCYGLPPEVNGPFIPDYAHNYWDYGHYTGDPWINTQAHVWVNLIASGGTGTTTRCPCAISPLFYNDFSSIYYAPSRFVQAVDWNRWDTNAMRPWEDWQGRETWASSLRAVSMTPWVEKNPDRENADFLAATGDGDQLMMLVRGSQDDVILNISQLEPGTYIAKIFDWKEGGVIETREIDVGTSVVSFPLDLSDDHLPSNGYCSANSGGCRLAIVYLEKEEFAPLSLLPCFGSNQIIDADDVDVWASDYLGSNDSIDIIADNKINSLEFGHLVFHWGEDCQ